MEINIFSSKNEPKSSWFINKEEIDTLIQFLSANPEDVSVWLKKDKEGFLLLNVKITVKRNSTIQKEMTIPADENLIQAVIYGLYGDLEDLRQYNESEHNVQNDIDPDTVKKETFYALLNTPFKLYLKDELVDHYNGERYITAYFQIAHKKMFNICLKKTEEISKKIKSIVSKTDVA
jgi:Holliday junction resolvase